MINPSITEINRKEVFVFDWDGTILDSMKIKANNFVAAFLSGLRRREDGLSEEMLIELYVRFSGRPRREIVTAVLNKLGIPMSGVSFERFNEEFGERNSRELVNADLFPDACAFMESLISQDKRIFISSSVPQDELEVLVEARMPRDLLRGLAGILGTSVKWSKGSGHIRHIEALTGLPKSVMIAFGDDLADYELNSGAGVDCILIDRGGRFSCQEVMAINNFSQLMS